MCTAKDRYTLIEQSSNSKITCMQYSQKNSMRIIGNDQKNNGQNFWEILERIIDKISSIIGAGLILSKMFTYYSQNYAGIIGAGLVKCVRDNFCEASCDQVFYPAVIIIWEYYVCKPFSVPRLN